MFVLPEGLFSLGLLVYAGLCLQAAGFMVRDELLLRGLVLTGLCLSTIFYVLQPEPIWEPAIANTVFILINLWLIAVIISERSKHSLTAQGRVLHAQLETMSPGHVRRLMRMGTLRVVEREETFIQQGDNLDQLFFFLSGDYTVQKSGTDFPMQGPAFAGEIVFLFGGKASATVTAHSGATIISWPHATLKKQMEASPNFKNALIARFSRDLASKVAQSTPTSELV